MAPRKKAAKKAKPAQRNAARPPSARKKEALKGATPDDTRQKAIAAILKGMEEGNSLRKSCAAAKTPNSTFLLWVDSDPALAEQYTRARARMLDVQADQLEDIGEEAKKAKSQVTVAGLRLQSDNRKWLLSKLAPKKYGEKLAVGGADDLPPVRTETLDLRGLDAAELSTLKKLLAKGKAALADGG